MRITFAHIKNILIIALLAILGLQMLWLHNMYRSYNDTTQNLIAQTFEIAIDEELQQRFEQIGKNALLRLAPRSQQDTLSLSEVTIETEDSTLVIPYNAAYRYNEKKANQTLMKYIIPLEISDLDTIFQGLLLEEEIPVQNMVIEFQDQDTGQTYYSGSIEKNISGKTFETETVFVDLIDSIGLKAYVTVPVYNIFQKMLFQLLLSIILIAAALICLLRLYDTIFQQRKEYHIKQDFVNSMTHELKRPISSSLYALEYTQEQIKENDFSSTEEYIADSVFSLKKLNSYIEKIQEISKGEENKIEFVWETIDLNEFFNQLKSKYESSTDKKLSIQIHIPDNLTMKTDKLHFANVMENLTENSIKYSGEEITININVYKSDNSLKITHWDNGWGIPQSEISCIFDPFFRSNSSDKRRKNGFGLGLSYVKLIANKMKGHIKVSSKENEFTEFTLTFPIKM